jgi:hypothetical protein
LVRFGQLDESAVALIAQDLDSDDVAVKPEEVTQGIRIRKLLRQAADE